MVKTEKKEKVVVKEQKKDTISKKSGNVVKHKFDVYYVRKLQKIEIAKIEKQTKQCINKEMPNIMMDIEKHISEDTDEMCIYFKLFPFTTYRQRTLCQDFFGNLGFKVIFANEERFCITW